MSENTHDPDDSRYTTVHGGVQLPNTHDPLPWSHDEQLVWMWEVIRRHCGLSGSPTTAVALALNEIQRELNATARADERRQARERVLAALACWCGLEKYPNGCREDCPKGRAIAAIDAADAAGGGTDG